MGEGVFPIHYTNREPVRTTLHFWYAKEGGGGGGQLFRGEGAAENQGGNQSHKEVFKGTNKGERAFRNYYYI